MSESAIQLKSKIDSSLRELNKADEKAPKNSKLEDFLSGPDAYQKLALSVLIT